MFYWFLATRQLHERFIDGLILPAELFFIFIHFSLWKKNMKHQYEIEVEIQYRISLT